MDPIRDATVTLLLRMCSHEYETGLFAFNGPASDVRFVAVGSRRTPLIRLTLTHQKLRLAVCEEDLQGFT